MGICTSAGVIRPREGTGVFNVSGGSATIGGLLKIWNTTDSAVNLSGGTLSVGTLDTSGNPALFHWTGGTLALTANNTFAGDLIVGDTTTESLSQLSGTLSVGGNLIFSNSAAGVGNGSPPAHPGRSSSAGPNLSAMAERATSPNPAETHSALSLRVGQVGSGTYNLTSGVLSTGVDEYVSAFGSGTFNQSGGTNTTPVLFMAGAIMGGSGTYNLSGTGVLNVTSKGRVHWLFSHRNLQPDRRAPRCCQRH